MDEEKKKRVQLTKEEKRLLAEKITQVAFADEEARRAARQAKTARLRALRETAIESGNKNN